MRVELPAPEFDLCRTIESGQIFHAMREGDGWQILIDRTPVYAEQRGAKLLVSSEHITLLEDISRSIIHYQPYTRRFLPILLVAPRLRHAAVCASSDNRFGSAWRHLSPPR